jgi:hypothetical protein
MAHYGSHDAPPVSVSRASFRVSTLDTLTLRLNHSPAATARSRTAAAAAEGVIRSDGDFGACDAT